MRPKIICHMVASIDGRLRYQRWSKPASGIDPDTLDGHYEKTADRFDADGWMVGTADGAEHVRRCPEKAQDDTRRPSWDSRG